MDIPIFIYNSGADVKASHRLTTHQTPLVDFKQLKKLAHFLLLFGFKITAKLFCTFFLSY